MTRRRRILASLFAFIVVALIALVLVLSYDAACADAPPVAAGTDTMSAVRARCYGGTEVLRVETVARPVPADDEIRVRVHAAGINPLDWHYMQGTPYVMRLESGIGRPASEGVGVDFAGTVDAVGASITHFKPGDEVFGGRRGAFAEYLIVREQSAVVPKPPGVSFEDAASLPIAAVTALQAVRDKGRVQAGQRVLVNGASGGVGTFAVQLAKARGAHVTGVCSTRNVDLVRSLGADAVVDYTREDFTTGNTRYDVIIDNVGNHPLLAYRDILTPQGIVVIVSGPKNNPWVGPMSRVVWATMLSPFVAPTYTGIIGDLNQRDLEELGALMAGGTLTATIDRRFTLAEIGEAIAYLELGRTRGKNVLVMVPSAPQ